MEFLFVVVSCCGWYVGGFILEGVRELVGVVVMLFLFVGLRCILGIVI